MALRKFSEDPRLRPFLSSHFDCQIYVNSVLKEERSEASFNEISSGIEEVNEEIKGYISVHRDDLMSGMQGVAQLAERYSGLSEKSQKLNKSIDRLKKEVRRNYDGHY